MTTSTLLGKTEPRVFTPPRRELTPETSHGFAAIAFAEEMLHMRLFPWQEWLLKHALELNPDATYRWRVVVVEVARQSGKTMVLIVLALWHMYALKSRTVIGTAQDLSNAEKVWKEAVSLAQADEELAEMIPADGIYLGHPKQFQIIHNELGRELTSEYRIAAATRRGGRGFSGDLILMDELREHQSWDSWAAVTNTMNARPRAQCWAFSNAPDAFGVVLRYLRALAHRELGWPDGDEDVQGEILGEIAALPEFEDMPEVEFDTGFFEWSMPPGLPRNDPEGLMQANPSCNHTEVTENCITYRALISGLRTSPAHIAEAEICCRETTLGVGGPFPEGSWETTRDETAKPGVGAKICVCVEVSNRREQTYVTRAGLTTDGVAVVGVAQDRAGTDWVVDYLKEQRKTYTAVVVRSGAASPVGALLKDLQDARLPIVEWKGTEISAGHGQMFDRLRDSTVLHLPHSGLDAAATSAVERNQPGGGWVVDHSKSPTDVAPLLAAIGAVWGLNHLPAVPRVHGWDMNKLENRARER
jgi:hypothetical protein